MFYANIDDQGICVGISNVSSSIDDPAYIEISSYDQSYLRRKYEGGAWTSEYSPLEDYKAEFIDTNPDPEEAEEPPAQDPREWRDTELYRTDLLMLLPDHPDKDKFVAYRQALRDWPSTSDFPNKKPTIGS